MQGIRVPHRFRARPPCLCVCSPHMACHTSVPGGWFTTGSLWVCGNALGHRELRVVGRGAGEGGAQVCDAIRGFWRPPVFLASPVFGKALCSGFASFCVREPLSPCWSPVVSSSHVWCSHVVSSWSGSGPSGKYNGGASSAVKRGAVAVVGEVMWDGRGILGGL